MNAVSYLKKLFLVSAVAGAIVVGSLAPSSAFLDKTRFVAHLGVAYFCFHHWVWKPYEEGAFSAGAPHRTSAIVKGGVALLFAVHEVGVAKKIADKSSDPLLRKLDGTLGELMLSFATIGQNLKSGHFDPKDLNVLSTLAGSFKSQAAAGGLPIKDVPVTLPGT